MAQLITNPINIQYLTGFKSSNAFIVIHRKKMHLFTDSRYSEAASKIKDVSIQLIDENFAKNFKDFLKQLKIKQLHAETNQLTVDRFERFKKICGKIPLVKVASKKMIERSREIKTPIEIKYIKKAQGITKKAITQAHALIKPGKTEVEIAWKIQMIIRDLGGNDISFEPIVAFGKNSAIPHHHPGNTGYKKNDIILIDAGAKYKDYCGDMTRTFLPKQAPAEMKEAYKAVEKVQKNALKNLKKAKSGIKLSTIAQKARTDFEKFEEYFTHSLGHGVGLEIHEGPWLSKNSNSTLKKGQVFSVEPGLYFPGKFGIRIEDLFFV